MTKDLKNQFIQLNITSKIYSDQVFVQLEHLKYAKNVVGITPSKFSGSNDSLQPRLINDLFLFFEKNLFKYHRQVDMLNIDRGVSL